MGSANQEDHSIIEHTLPCLYTLPNDFRKTLIKPLYKKGDKSECRNYRGISLVSVGRKLLSNIILFRLRHAVDKVLREEQCGFRKGRGCVDHVFTLRLIIEKSLRCQIPLVLSFIDYEQAFDSVDRTALTKVLSLSQISLHQKNTLK